MSNTPRNQMGLAGQIAWLPDQDYNGTPAVTPPGCIALSQVSTTTITNAATLYPTLYSRYTSTDTKSPIYRSGSSLIVQKTFQPKETKWINIMPSCITTNTSSVPTGSLYFIYAAFFLSGSGWRLKVNLCWSDASWLHIGGVGNLAVVFANNGSGIPNFGQAFQNISAGGTNYVQGMNGTNYLSAGGNIAPLGVGEFPLTSEPNWTFFSASGFTTYAQIAEFPNQTAFLRLTD